MTAPLLPMEPSSVTMMMRIIATGAELILRMTRVTCCEADAGDAGALGVQRLGHRQGDGAATRRHHAGVLGALDKSIALKRGARRNHGYNAFSTSLSSIVQQKTWKMMDFVRPRGQSPRWSGDALRRSSLARTMTN